MTLIFKNVSLSIDNSLLTIDLDENPIIENIEILGIKNKSFRTNWERNFIKRQNVFSENFLNKDVNLIKNIFKSSGYYFVKIDSSYTKNDELNSIRLKLNINEGERARIKEILFIGDKKLKIKDFLKL